MKYRIAKSWQFSASHCLDHLPEGHKCARLHGHTYTVTLTLESDSLNKDGFVIDFGELDAFGDALRAKYDHRHLNDVMRDPRLDHKHPSIQKAAVYLAPTCENIAMELFTIWSQVWTQLISVRVSESPATYAEVGR